MIEPEHAMLRVEQVAELLAVSRMTVYRRIRDGDLFAYRIGQGLRVPRTAFVDYLRAAGTRTNTPTTKETP